jgi:hypothetical protein
MINRILRFVCMMLATLFLAQSVHAGYFYEGNGLVKAMREYEKAETKDRDTDYSMAWQYRGYVIGVHDATDLMYGPKQNVSERQICAIVAKYLKAHPEKWNEPASDLVITALKEAFPIRP